MPSPRGQYDITVIHPPAGYYNGRASWYSMNGERKAVFVKRPGHRAFLAQAYYAGECRGRDYGTLIPADQTYILAGHDYYTLYLRKGVYRIVFRDMDYAIVVEQTIDTRQQHK